MLSWWNAKTVGIITAPSIHFKDDASERALNKLKEVYNLGRNL